MTGHIEQKGLSCWNIVVNLDKDLVTGKRKRMSRVINGPKQEAERVMSEMLQQLASRSPELQTDSHLQAD